VAGPPRNASLEVDGVWKTGVWATTVWEDGVWREGEPIEPVWDLTGLPVTWEPLVDVLNYSEFVAIKQQECDGDAVWAKWRAGTSNSPRGSSNCVVQTDIIRAEANGSAVWARWAPGTARNSANLQVNIRAALTADFQ
jgi:hypothetical protein